MTPASQQIPAPPVTTRLVEQLADHKGVDPVTPEFCLYEDLDIEALERLLASADGPLTTRFRVAGATVTVEKTPAGEITVNVAATNQHHQAMD